MGNQRIPSASIRFYPLNRGDYKKLEEKFEVCKSYISQSMHFKINSLKARKIRDYAVNSLGFVMV